MVLRHKILPRLLPKKGFTCPRTLNQRTKTISLRELDEITKQQTTQTIDLDSMGYTKLLATGKLTRPLTIKIASTSKAAITKIKAAGGQIQTETETDAETEEAEEKEEE